MQIVLLSDDPAPLKSWIAPRRGGGAVPFYGWAMHVDSQYSMYVSDHGMDEQRSPYGRVVKLAPNGTQMGEWSMSDGTAYSFSSVWLDDQTASGGACAIWLADSERGMVRVAADGTVLLPFYAAPVDAADGLTARFTGMAGETNVRSRVSSLLLLDTASATTSKLWRFSPSNRTYTLLNTTSAQLGPNVVGVTVNYITHDIYVSDTRTRAVLRLHADGELDASFNMSGVGLAEPAALLLRPELSYLFVADYKYNGDGAVLSIELATQRVFVPNNTEPAMYRPLSLAQDAANNKLYVSDSNGYVFEFDANTWWRAVTHQPVPAATNIVSMGVKQNGNVYMLDAYSRRLIILMYQEASWQLGNDCLPPALPSSSSSSSSSAVHSSTSSWSSSSTASSMPTSRSRWSTALVASLVVLGVVTATGGASCYYMRRRKRQRHSSGRDAPNERLLAAGGHTGRV